MMGKFKQYLKDFYWKVEQSSLQKLKLSNILQQNNIITYICLNKYYNII